MTLTPVQERFRKLLRGSLLGACPRRLGYMAQEEPVEVTDPPLIKASENPRFDDGHWHEFDIKRRQAEAGVIFECGLRKIMEIRIRLADDWAVNGHLDGVIRVPQGLGLRWLRTGRHISEDKSMAQGMYWKFVKAGYQETFPSYYDQIQGYLHSEFVKFTNVLSETTPVKELYKNIAYAEVDLDDSDLIPETAQISGKNKENGSIWGELVPADEGYFTGLCRRWTDADLALSVNAIPDRHHEDPNNYECRECPWMKECWEEVAVAPSVLEVTEDTREAVRLYKIGKALERTAKNMLDYAEPYLSPQMDGKFEVEDMKINRYQTKRTSYNDTELRKLLTTEQYESVTAVKSYPTTRRTAPSITLEELRGYINTEGFKELEGGKDGSDTE